MKQTTGQKTSSPLRYSIKRRLAEMEPSRASAIKRRVRKQCDVPRSSLSRYLNEKKGGPNNMPVPVLQAFAEALSLQMEELLNH